jgi:hypothetical protein
VKAVTYGLAFGRAALGNTDAKILEVNLIATGRTIGDEVRLLWIPESLS